ncbi:MAG TPA: hypothetical protein PKB13_07480 [Clostridia bacterium]|nr:hypothetical protein [Clostridia bacterium]
MKIQAPMKIHMHILVRDWLLKDDEFLRGMATAISVDGVELQTAAQVRSALMDELDAGHECIPIGDCDNFDYKTGCNGHPIAPEGGQDDA